VANGCGDMSEASAAVPSGFRDAIARARLATADSVLTPAPPPDATSADADPADRFEYRVKRTKGSGRRRRASLEALGRRGWELVGVDGGFAYLKRRLP